MSKLWTVIRHNQGLAVSIVLAGILCIWGFGCESKVQSLTRPDHKVTRDELALELGVETALFTTELEKLVAKARLREKELDKQDEFKAAILELGLIAAEGGTINPVGAVVTLAGILGVGAVVDNRRKDLLIKKTK